MNQTGKQESAARWRDVVTWLGDRLPDPLGSWLLRLADDSTEPWVDAEGRLMRRD